MRFLDGCSRYQGRRVRMSQQTERIRILLLVSVGLCLAAPAGAAADPLSPATQAAAGATQTAQQAVSTAQGAASQQTASTAVAKAPSAPGSSPSTPDSRLTRVRRTSSTGRSAAGNTASETRSVTDSAA